MFQNYLNRKGNLYINFLPISLLICSYLYNRSNNNINQIITNKIVGKELILQRYQLIKDIKDKLISLKLLNEFSYLKIIEVLNKYNYNAMINNFLNDYNIYINSLN